MTQPTEFWLAESGVVRKVRAVLCRGDNKASADPQKLKWRVLNLDEHPNSSKYPTRRQGARLFETEDEALRVEAARYAKHARVVTARLLGIYHRLSALSTIMKTIPDPVKLALAVVRLHYPGVVGVAFFPEGRWLYFRADGSAPCFDRVRVDQAVLEDAINCTAGACVFQMEELGFEIVDASEVTPEDLLIDTRGLGEEDDLVLVRRR